jgi:hypothetical protein
MKDYVVGSVRQSSLSRGFGSRCYGSRSARFLQGYGNVHRCDRVYSMNWVGGEGFYAW